jgi:hypothetical protein
MNKLLIGIVGFTVLTVHTAAQAQQVEPAAPEYPPVYAPPPGYVPPTPPPTYGAPPAYVPPPVYAPPPPPVYRYAPPPVYRYAPPYRYAAPFYYAPPQRDPLERPFTLGGGIGFGGLVFDDAYTGNRFHQGGFAYTFRLGFGLRPGLLLLWDVEGAIAETDTSTVSQTANLVALQIFLTRRLFVKGGFGVADAVQDNLPTQWGAAAMGGVGYELVQGWNWSFDVEATATGARFNSNGYDQTWTNWSLVNFALNFF